jgi:hypothetical protein
MKDLKILLLAFVSILFLQSCSDDEEMDVFSSKNMSFSYAFHNGQTVPTAPYAGIHPSDFSATLMLESMENGNTMITVTLNNTVEGAIYNIHSHDAADPASTPNGTPYNESPNADILVQQAEGNGGSVTVMQEALMSYDDLLNSYEAFFVIHDPLQPMSTVDISTYLTVGAFARMQAETNYQSQSFNYNFNMGQLVPDFAYSGSHSTDLQATIQVDELADNRSRISIRLMNTMEGETYATHAHDMADPADTPNGTPYIESPNADVFAMPIMGNGGMAGGTNISERSYSEITMEYDGFFVVHDPLQAINTADPTTYLVLGVFAR